MSSATIRKRQQDIEAFVEALGRFLGTMERHEPTFVTAASWTPRPGQEAEANRLRFEVDRASGRAAYALAAAGSFIAWEPRGTFQTQPVSPAAEWATILDWDPKFPADAIFACCSQALGILDMKAEAAEERESRPLHRLRVAMPSPPRGWVGRHAAALMKWTGGIVATVVAAVLVYMLGLS